MQGDMGWEPKTGPASVYLRKDGASWGGCIPRLSVWVQGQWEGGQGEGLCVQPTVCYLPLHLKRDMWPILSAGHLRINISLIIYKKTWTSQGSKHSHLCGQSILFL